MKETRKLSWLLIALILLITAVLPTGRSSAANGFTISGRNLLDANGNNFIIRGISHPHTWYTSQTSSFANIKATGANTVRVVLSGGRWTKNTASDVANVINLCKTNRLICVLEDHDTTGYGEQSGAYTLAQAVEYWREIQSVLTGQEAYVIINIGNEPYGNNNPADWTNATINAITAMRAAGFKHTLMVDAPSWGQDWAFVMRDNAASVFASDPDRNTIFSVHMYGVFDTSAEVQSYVASFVNAGLPLVIGEFGNMHSDGNPDEDAIMSTAHTNGIGYMGWSWSGNGGGVEYLDMVTNFDPAQRTTWGTRIISGANGISTTSVEASVFGGITPTFTATGPTPTRTNTPTATATTPPGACAVAYTPSNWNNGFTADIRITNNGSTAIQGWTLTFSYANGQQITSSWNATVTQSGANVTASNQASHWNGTIAANGGYVSFGVQGTHNGTNPTPTNFVLNGVACNGGPQPTTPTNTPTATLSPTPWPTFVIKGYVRLGSSTGAGLPGVSIAVYYGSPAGTVTTDANGYYQISLLAPPNQETTSLTPSLAGYTFNPVSYNWITYSNPPSEFVRDFVANGGITQTPTPTATATPTPTATTPSPASGCEVTYTMNQWQNGFTANVSIKNIGTSAINGWALAWAFPGNQAITNAWNATVVQNGQNVTATNMGYNANIPINGSVGFGFQASFSGTNSVPTRFTLNGAACTIR